MMLQAWRLKSDVDCDLAVFRSFPAELSAPKLLFSFCACKAEVREEIMRIEVVQLEKLLINGVFFKLNALAKKALVLSKKKLSGSKKRKHNGPAFCFIVQNRCKTKNRKA